MLVVTRLKLDLCNNAIQRLDGVRNYGGKITFACRTQLPKLALSMPSIWHTCV